MNAASENTSRIRSGRVLGLLGTLSPALGVGIAIGFYLADQGVRWLPTTLSIVLGFVALGLFLVPLGSYLEGEAFKVDQKRKRIRRRVVASLFIGSVAVIARLVVFWMQAPSPLTSLSQPAFGRVFRLDSERYKSLDKSLEGFYQTLVRQKGLWSKGLSQGLQAGEERILLDAWAGVYDAAFALDQIRAFYEDWYRFDPSRAQRAFHVRSFLLTYVAELSLFEKSSRLTALLHRNPNVVKFLNAPHPKRNLPQDTLSFVQQELQGARDQARVQAGREYLRFLEAGLAAKSECEALGCLWLWQAAEKHLARIALTSSTKQLRASIAADSQILQRSLNRVWYPTQKSVAEWMGDTRVRRPGRYLIQPAQEAKAQALLKPGDFLLARKNWYLSNIGLPGFWPHAVLYIGDEPALRAYFDDSEVRQHLKMDLPSYLAKHYPERWLEFRASQKKHPLSVIEAISEGVVFNTFHAASGDYLAGLRPRLSKAAKAQAIIEAFSHLQKPYDFNFDFATDDMLVCTELVWRSYRPSENKPGLNLQLKAVMGRSTLPANHIVTQFAAEHGSTAAQMDFVFFIDANERSQKAYFSTEAAFLKTHKRTKWDVALD
jgi:hypothetical protein